MTLDQFKTEADALAEKFKADTVALMGRAQEAELDLVSCFAIFAIAMKRMEEEG